ncbi:MAG: N-6 DNA methylase [Patescibacteria group bacterium]
MKKETKQKIKKLVEKYEKAKNSGILKSYSEEETKKDFILPLFEALGWNTFEKKEVSAEEHIESSGRVDYGFYLNDRVKFYLEAKKISVDLFKEDYAHQAIRYSFNKGVVWAILTDFEGLIVFNAQEINKSLADKKLFDIPYNQYIKRFEQLWLLSRESFENDLIDKYAEEHGKKLQKVPISSLLYKDLQECRDILTNELGQWNSSVDSDTLDEGVQKLLDRLIFIRVAEDRKVEEAILIPMVRQARKESGGRLYQSMIKKFRELDEIYNSNLFKKHTFEEWEDHSGATEKAINKLYGKPGYYEYDFKAMSPDVLGAVYESYLSHRLSQSKKGITVSKDAKKRKEQGIYYTPPFIVDYIVKNALGPVLDRCKSIRDIQKIKVLDPACGSGSFLIRVLNLIYEKYLNLGSEKDKFSEMLIKIQILKNNIYGVDLDPQAIEITRLNLLINSLTDNQKLPFLDNIKNGNSLISGTDEELKKYFGKNFRDKKSFNWQEEFPEVFAQGGFDVVIGNPPYIQSRNLNDEERHFYWEKYLTDTNHSDIYSFFIEKAINILKNEAFLGFIIPNTWLQTPSFVSLRAKIFNDCALKDVLFFEEGLKVFESAQISNVVLICQKELNKKVLDNNFVDVVKNITDTKSIIFSKIRQKDVDFKQGFNIFNNPETKNIINKIFKNSILLNEVGKIIGGLRTGDDIKFLKKKTNNENDRKLLRGRDVGRYSLSWNNEYVWYRPELMKVKQAAAPKEAKFFETKEKLLVRMITGSQIVATYDDTGYYFLQDNLILPKNGYDIKYLLVILNSAVINFIVKNSTSNIAVTQSLLKTLPIYKINFSNKKEKAKHDELVKLADKMLKLNEDLQKIAENSDKWNSIKSEIEKTDKKIDAEVYRLYGLTAEEIKIVENK